MITQSLPGITSLGYVPSERLQRQIMQKALAGLPVGVFTDIAPINFVGVPTCVTQSDYDNNGRLEKASLKFVTNDNIPIFKDIAFVMTDSNGKSWLLGTKERPRPIIRIERSTGTPEGDGNEFAFEVSLYAHKALIECQIKY